MKKVLLSSVALLSLVCASPVVYGETTSSSTPQKTTVSSVEKVSTTTSSSTPVKDSSTGSTTSSSTKDSTSSSSSAKTETSTTSKLETQTSSQTSTGTTSSSTTNSSSSSSTESSSTTNSSTQETTQSSTVPAITSLKARTGWFAVKNGVKLLKDDLLRLVTYTNGDKNNLDVYISSNYVYVSKNGQQSSKVYHTDLNALLGTANLNNIQVMTFAQAQKLGFTLAQGNANKNIEIINCSLPGQYKVTFRDRKTGLSTTTIVNVGNPASAVVPENTQNSGTVNQTTTTSSTVATPKTNNVTTPKATTKAPATTKSSIATAKTTPVLTSKSTLPKTGEEANHILAIAGVLTTLSVSAFIVYRKFR